MIWDRGNTRTLWAACISTAAIRGQLRTQRRLAKLVTDAKLAHSGEGAIQFTAMARSGRESGVGASGWFGPAGYDRVYFRRYVKFAADYDQGNLNHVGGGLAAVAGTDRWRAMGSAGIRPRGDDHFHSAFEPWRDWGRYTAPGYMFLYTYWMDMKRDPDGHYWGNMLGPADTERIVLQRERWYCLEHMIQANDVGTANGELAAWIDGKLYIHYKGFRWRTSADVKLKRFNIGVYVHQATKDNTPCRPFRLDAGSSRQSSAWSSPARGCPRCRRTHYGIPQQPRIQ